MLYAVLHVANRNFYLTIMILWTIQNEKIYNILQETGIYHCDPEKLWIPELVPFYDWLAERMKEKVGEPPVGVKYPVWAWYKLDNKRKKPDLRSERWGNGWKGERFVCMEIDIPDEQVVLSDFDAWSIILLHGLLTETKEEDDLLNQKYESLSPDEQLQMMHENWNRVFDLSPVHNTWARRGETIQATFWELKRENVRKVQWFTAAAICPYERV